MSAGEYRAPGLTLEQRVKAFLDSEVTAPVTRGLVVDLLAALAEVRAPVVSEEPEAETIAKLRDQIEQARNAWWSATEQGDNGLVYTDRIEDAMDEIWNAIGDAGWLPVEQEGETDAS